jgi:hypothetical protein
LEEKESEVERGWLGRGESGAKRGSLGMEEMERDLLGKKGDRVGKY